MDAALPAALAAAAPRDVKTRARRQAFRAAMAFHDARIRASIGGRIALFMALAIATVTLATALFLRGDAGAMNAATGLARRAAGLTAWLSGGLLAVLSARDTMAEDRQSGLSSLAAARGVGERALSLARAAAGMRRIAFTTGLPLGAMALGLSALATSAREALRAVGLAAGLLIFAAIVAVTLGGAASACARVWGARGRGFFVALVLGEFVLADVWGRSAWSLPGALRAVLAVVFRVVGGGHVG